jgi:tetratricopeptide (TPR) repeat protein
LDHALLAVRMARPDRPRDAAKRALEAARTVLERASVDVARREAVTATTGPPGPNEDIDMERRVLMKALMGASLAPMGALEALERTRGLTARQSRVDDALVWAFRSLLGAYSQGYETMEPGVLAPSVAALVDRVTERLSEPMVPAQRRELGRIAAESAGLAGWLSHSLDQQGRAHAYFSLARDAAVDADDPMLHAMALGCLSQLVSTTPAGGCEGSPAALRLLQEANDRLPDEAPSSARTWLAARLAEECAALGDGDGYLRHMTRAEDAWVLARVGDDRRGFFSQQGFFAQWEDGRFDGYRAICLILLDEPYQAEDHLAKAVGRTLGQSRSRATLLTDMTAAYALQGEPEQACETARGSIAASTQAGFPMGLQRLRGARRHLDRWQRHPDVVDLDERLAAAA